jgi:hypothetical protein
MAQFYLDPSRESEVHVLPDAEVFYMSVGDIQDAGTDSVWYDDDGDWRESGWYWWPCFPGCLPDSDPSGPFDTEELAIADAREGGAL